MFLFDPITCKRQPITYEQLKGITGKSKETLACYKSRRRKIANINSYLVDDDVDVKVLREFMVKEEIEDECFVNIPGTSYEVSNYGRYKNKKGQFIVVHNNVCGKRVRPMITLMIDKKSFRCAPSYFVGKIFVEKPVEKLGEQLILGHRDYNSFNCRATNLYYVDKVKYARRVAQLASSRICLKIDDSGNVIEEYDSAAQASRRNYYHRLTIAKAIKKGQRVGGFIYMYEDEYIKVYGERND